MQTYILQHAGERNNVAAGRGSGVQHFHPDPGKVARLPIRKAIRMNVGKEAYVCRPEQQTVPEGEGCSSSVTP